MTLSELDGDTATGGVSGDELDSAYGVDNEGGAATTDVFDGDGIGYGTMTVELGSGINVDKLYGGIGSPVACTCGRSAPAVVAIKVSKSQTPKQPLHVLTTIHLVGLWYRTTDYTYRQRTQHHYC